MEAKELVEAPVPVYSEIDLLQDGPPGTRASDLGLVEMRDLRYCASAWPLAQSWLNSDE